MVNGCRHTWLGAFAIVTLAAQLLAAPILSDGSDGAFSPTGSQTLNLQSVAPDGVFNFTTITIPAGVTVKFSRNTANTPVYFAATGNVVIDGIIDLSAGGTTRTGGAGGADGGLGGAGAGSGGQPGGGPGGGGGGPGGDPKPGNAGGGGGMAMPGLQAYIQNTGPSPANGGPIVSLAEPLPGGSGGGGGGGWTSFGVVLGGGAGGGGGGALIISTPGSITIGGTLRSNGGNGSWGFANISGYGGPGGGGSGGLLALYASAIVLEDTAVLEARGGYGGGVSTQPYDLDPALYTCGANGGLGYAILSAEQVNIGGGAVLDLVLPEPSTIALLGGVAGLLARRRRHPPRWAGDRTPEGLPPAALSFLRQE